MREISHVPEIHILVGGDGGYAVFLDNSIYVEAVAHSSWRRVFHAISIQASGYCRLVQAFAMARAPSGRGCPSVVPRQWQHLAEISFTTSHW